MPVVPLEPPALVPRAQRDPLAQGQQGQGGQGAPLEPPGAIGEGDGNYGNPAANGDHGTWETLWKNHGFSRFDQNDGFPMFR